MLEMGAELFVSWAKSPKSDVPAELNLWFEHSGPGPTAHDFRGFFPGNDDLLRSKLLAFRP